MKKNIQYILVFLFIILLLWLFLKPKENKQIDNNNESISGLENKNGELPSASNENSDIVKSNMKIETIKEGTGEGIKNGQTAVMEYVGKFENGEVFDASSKHGSDFEFVLGQGMVIKGWDEGVLGMKVGEERTLIIPPQLAYGANGIPGAIPPNSTLVFDVKLKAIK